MNPHRVGMLHGGSLGDFVLSWHLLRSVVRAASARAASVWARRPMADTDPALWGLDELYDAEACGLHGLFAEGNRAPASPVGRLGECDLLINCLPEEDSAFSRNLRAIASGPVVCLDPRPLSGSGEHIVRQWSARLGDAGVGSGAVQPARLLLERGKVEQARARLESMSGAKSGRTVLIHPGSGGRAKCWALANYLELAGRLRSAEITSVFVIGPVEEDLFTEQERGVLSRWPTIRSLSLTELAALSAAADLCVCNDSGFGHLAAASGTRVLSIFGATAPSVWRPLGRRVHVAGRAGHWPTWAEVLECVRTSLGEDRWPQRG